MANHLLADAKGNNQYEDSGSCRVTPIRSLSGRGGRSRVYPGRAVAVALNDVLYTQRISDPQPDFLLDPR